MQAKVLGPYNGYDHFVEWPKMLYNERGEQRRCENAQEEADLGPAWQCRSDGQPLVAAEAPVSKRGRKAKE